VEVRAQEITRERADFRADQFVRAGNWHAHTEATGPEIVKQASQVDSFCDFVGSGGTFRGCAQALRAVNLLCAAMWLNPPAPRYWQDASLCDRVTEYKVVVTLSVIFHSSRVRRLMDISR
jgi:cysteine synthase